MRRAVVTGAAGFVGSTLSERLVAEGFDVVGIDCFTDYYPLEIKRSNVADLVTSSRFRLVDRSLNDGVDDLLPGADVVFHQAGQPGVRPSWGRSFSAYTRDNINATQALLESVARVTPTAKIVYASSSSVYGDADRYPTEESDLPRPLSPYGVTKLAAEHLMSLYARNFGLNTVSLRYFTVYGPRQRPDMAFTRFIGRALSDSPVELFGDGTQIRDFTFVDDIVNANMAAATQTVEPGAVLNVSGGSHVSINEVLTTLGAILGQEIRVTRRDRATGDVRRTGGSTALAKSTISWQAQTTLKRGLAAQVDWLKPRVAQYRDAIGLSR